MEKLDRLGWAAGTCLLSHGLRIGIRVNDPEVLGRLAAHFPPGWKPAQSGTVDRLYSLRVAGTSSPSRVRHYNLLYAGPLRLARTLERDELFGPFESDLQLYVAAKARRKVFVHAGVVGWRGQAIVIPGRSFSGKTTLVAALVRAGATYYSDEFAIFDARGRVHPFPRPLSVREGAGQQPGKYPVEALGGTVGVQPLPVGVVLVSQYREGARWRPRPLSPGQAVLALLANTVPVRRRPEAALAALQEAVANARALKGVRGEAEQVVDPILERPAA